MQITINIKKIHIYIFAGLISIFSLLLIVNGAYVGHTWNEITGTPVLSDLVVTGNIQVIGNISANDIDANGIEAQDIGVNNINTSGNVEIDGTLISNKMTTETTLKIGTDIGDEGALRWQGTVLQINDGTDWIDVDNTGTGSSSDNLVNNIHTVIDCLVNDGTPMYSEDSDGIFCKFRTSDCSLIDDGTWTNFKTWRAFDNSEKIYKEDWCNPDNLIGVPSEDACKWEWLIFTDHAYSCGALVNYAYAFKDQPVIPSCTLPGSCGGNVINCIIDEIGCY